MLIEKKYFRDQEKQIYGERNSSEQTGQNNLEGSQISLYIGYAQEGSGSFNTCKGHGFLPTTEYHSHSLGGLTPRLV